ncbi:putative dehydrogenase [Jackrogersella minutella]|nr:putative dehydrogenase [Jackrogersella minutella]
MAKAPRVIIAGGGPVGLYAAHALAKANIDYVILEQQSEIIRYKGAGIVLIPNSSRLLDQIRLLKYVEEQAVRLHSKLSSMQNGQPLVRFRLFEPMEENHGYSSYGFSRSQLIQILYDNLPGHETRVKTNARVVDIETNPDGVRVRLADGSVEEGTIIIGADGVHSRTREIMDKLARASSKEADGETTSAPKMVAHFKAVFGRVRYHGGLEKGLFYETHGTGVATQAVPGDEYTYFALLRALPTPTTTRRTYTSQELEEEAKSLADIQLFPGVKFGYIWPACNHEEASMVQLEEGILDRWYHGRIALLGDAVHKTTPITGMGVNIGFQSATVLVNQLHSIMSSGSDFSDEALEKAFDSYQKIQAPRCQETVKQDKLMTRLITWSGWKAWFFDRFVLPWMDLENQVKTQTGSILSNSYVLDWVPFKTKVGLVPWVNSFKGEAAQ